MFTNLLNEYIALKLYKPGTFEFDEAERKLNEEIQRLNDQADHFERVVRALQTVIF